MVLEMNFGLNKDLLEYKKCTKNMIKLKFKSFRTIKEGMNIDINLEPYSLKNLMLIMY